MSISIDRYNQWFQLHFFPVRSSVSKSKSSIIVGKNSLKSSLNSKRYCKFNKDWLKVSKYESFLQECRTDSSLAHCSICKSNFSSANGGKYLIDRHIEQATHQRFAAVEPKHKCKLVYCSIQKKISIEFVNCLLARPIFDFISH